MVRDVLYHIPDNNNVELVVQFGYFVDIFADQCQVFVVGMCVVDFFCNRNLTSIDVYTCYLATEVQKGFYISSFSATNFKNMRISRYRFMFFNERYYIFLCRNTLFVEILLSVSVSFLHIYKVKMRVHFKV